VKINKPEEGNLKSGCMDAKGQISSEILILIGMLLVFLVPLLLYGYGKINQAGDDLSIQQAEFSAQRLASLSDSVGYLGGNAAIIDEIQIPSDTENISIQNNRDVVITVDSPAGPEQIVQASYFNLTSPNMNSIVRPGNYFIDVQAISNISSSSQVELVVQ
jgi:hypothetical protein